MADFSQSTPCSDCCWTLDQPGTSTPLGTGDYTPPRKIKITLSNGTGWAACLNGLSWELDLGMGATNDTDYPCNGDTCNPFYFGRALCGPQVSAAGCNQFYFLDFNFDPCYCGSLDSPCDPTPGPGTGIVIGTTVITGDILQSRSPRKAFAAGATIGTGTGTGVCLPCLHCFVSTCPIFGTSSPASYVTHVENLAAFFFPRGDPYSHDTLTGTGLFAGTGSVDFPRHPTLYLAVASNICGFISTSGEIEICTGASSLSPPYGSTGGGLCSGAGPAAGIGQLTGPIGMLGDCVPTMLYMGQPRPDVRTWGNFRLYVRDPCFPNCVNDTATIQAAITLP